jgi:hypothetical protein
MKHLLEAAGAPVITLELSCKELFPKPNEAWLNPKRRCKLKFQTSAAQYLAQVYADDLRGSRDPQLGQERKCRSLGARAQGMLNALQLIVTPETLAADRKHC